MTPLSARVAVFHRFIGWCVRTGPAFACLVAAATVAAAQGWETKITTGAIPAQTPPLFHLAHPKNKLVQIAPPAGEPKPAPVKDVPAAVQKEPAVPAAKEYCVNIIDSAADARVAWQKKLLADAGKEIDERIAQLEKKTAEYKAWLKRRDEFTQRATDTVLQIYERMRPDAAAVQLAQLDDETAAAVLAKLKPTLSSKILNDMDPTRAAHLTSTIVGSGKVYPAVAKSTKVEAEK
jgi:flagellar motility protein MotE (MotC chaperone)